MEPLEQHTQGPAASRSSSQLLLEEYGTRHHRMICKKTLTSKQKHQRWSSAVLWSISILTAAEIFFTAFAGVPCCDHSTNCSAAASAAAVCGGGQREMADSDDGWLLFHDMSVL
jgi:hypothetical protein